MFFLKLNFQDNGHLHANCLFCILIIYRKCFAFQFSCRGIGMHISILTGVQNRRFSSWKNGYIFLKKFILNNMQMARFVLSLINVNAFI